MSAGVCSFLGAPEKVFLPFVASNGTPLQYSCLENPMDGGAWWAAVHGVKKSQTRLSDFTFTLHLGEGNGNPLQCSCLENPRDGGAWWLPSMGSHRVGHDWSDLAAAAAAEAARIPWLMVIVKAGSGWLSFFKSYPFKTHCSASLILVITLGPLGYPVFSPPLWGQLITNLNFPHNLNFPLLHMLTYSQVLVIGCCRLKRCTVQELRVKFYFRQNEDYSLGDSTQDSPKRLLQRGSGER